MGSQRRSGNFLQEGTEDLLEEFLGLTCLTGLAADVGVDWGEQMKASSRQVPGLGEGEVVCTILEVELSTAVWSLFIGEGDGLLFTRGAGGATHWRGVR